MMAATAVWLSDSDSAQAENVCEREMHHASVRYDVPLGIVYAVGLTETGRKNSLQPYAMNIEGRAEFMPSQMAAVRRFDEVRAEGAKLIDLGCMQINYYYHSKEFPSVAAMLMPSLNVDYAARFLRQLRQREGNWTMAVARYHAGPNNDPAQKRYVCRVMTNMVATGFGNWTPQARSFCFG
ncbi:transglycosylase SLT domain-containing protein [Ochrobactrum vermis]|uniref:Transglycosylase SLT domain-containing protein n=1 Tax=Ochrobactrum vermis TaxID=1827297 RepID=A0ABU8PIX0_9HYPH|nr:transglycosylase SLT domain-containing protein [Ochrobactrum vermis]PQZ25750.1 lytic transglycosylase [Ochrobactrum vermis]